jgi:hypothetical protein
MVEIEDGPFEGHLWAEPSEKHLKVLMKRVFEFPDFAKRKGTKAREDMVRRSNGEVLSEKVVNIIKRLVSERAEVIRLREEEIDSPVGSDEL